jgi:uncharacterized protein
MELIILLFLAFCAGFIDAVVGGGGLIQLPAFRITYPSMSIPITIGSNKLAGFCGTSIAAIRYVKNAKLHWDAILPAIFASLIFSRLGAQAVSHLDPTIVKPLILVLLIVVAIYTFVKKDFGLHHKPHLNKQKTRIYSFLTGAILGFYDGFFGPGTGSFLIVIYINIFGFDFLTASASAKLVNLGSNLSALIYFAFTHQVRYDLAIPVAACNMIGAWLGARIAIRKGSGFIRILFLIMVIALIAKMSYDLYTAP